MMQGGRSHDDNDNDYEGTSGEHSRKGKSFRGGSKKVRDKWYGYDDPDFQRWWHRAGKKQFGGSDLENAEEAEQVYEYWVSIGKPNVR